MTRLFITKSKSGHYSVTVKFGHTVLFKRGKLPTKEYARYIYEQWQKDTAFADGSAHFLAGKQMDTCPFPSSDNILFREFMRGFIHAKNLRAELDAETAQ